MKILRATPALIAKLPQWAQAHIEHLGREVAQRDRLLTELSEATTPTPFSYTSLLDVPGKEARRFYLPEYASLSVFAGPGSRLDYPKVLDLSVRDRGRGTENALYVSALRGGIQIMPSCSNGVFIINKEW